MLWHFAYKCANSLQAVHTQQQRQLQYEVFVATDAAIAEQIGSSKWFDLVDFDQLPSGHRFRVHKLAAFSELQQQVGGAYAARTTARLHRAYAAIWVKYTTKEICYMWMCRRLTGSALHCYSWHM